MRDKILEFLKDKKAAVRFKTLADEVGAKSKEDKEELNDVLKKLDEEYLVYRTNEDNYILYSNCLDFKKGKMQINDSGNGFVVIPDEPDVFIDRKFVGMALPGDTVIAKVFDLKARKPEGMVIKVFENERNLKTIVGSIKSDGKSLYFEPSKKTGITLIIDEDSLKSCVEGEIVVVSTFSNLGKNKYTAAVTKHVCHKDDAMSDILEIAAKHDIYPEFPEDAMAQAEAMPNEIAGELLEEESKFRRDLTDKMIFTIDGADTKDIDDAISLEVKDGYYILGVHIADVAHYVTEDSPLDKEARKRGTSSYLAYSVIPMLPHKLSNGICSLNPDVIRCALSCEMKIDNRGRVVDSEIFASLIKSRKKMTYTAVNKIIEDNEIPEGYEEFASTLKAMQELAHIIREDRTKRGASDFDIDEAKIICDETGKPTDIKVRERGEGERLIEDFMIAANETVARTLAKEELPAIYRVHGTPSEEKIQEFINFCNATGQNIVGKFKGELKPKMYQSLLSQIKVEGPASYIYRSLAVRSMPKAFYDTENIGHFGLAVIAPYNAYTHFTSPIRRYPDTQTHRLLWSYIIKNEKYNEDVVNHWRSILDEVAKNSSDRENEAVKAEREVDKMKMAEYMQDHVGEEFDAIVSDVVGYGLYVQLDNLIEGLVHITTLPGHFEVNKEMKCMIDPSSKKTYRIGDSLRVKCVSASKEESKIDFEEVRERVLNDEESTIEEEPVKKLLRFGKRRK